MSDLITNLMRIFGSKEFDATDILGAAHNDLRLSAAIDAAIPLCRYISGWKKGELNVRVIRRALKRSEAIRTIRHEANYYSFQVQA